MRIVDFAETPEGAPASVDVLVIGSGPAGMTVASELVGSGLSVLVVEGGGLRPSDDTTFGVDSVGVPRVQPQSLVRTRALGGTSAVWSGRCTPLDAIDFEQRDWVPGSGWPIDATVVDAFLPRACAYFQLGPQEYGEALWPELGLAAPTPALDPTLLRERFWHYSRGVRDPAHPTRFGVDTVADINVLINATVVRLDESDGRVVAAQVAARSGQARRIAVGRVVLAAGAIESPRLLLASGLGNTNTGRYLMDHPGATIATLDYTTAKTTRERFGLYWKKASPFRLAFMNGIALSPEVQREEKLLNAAFWLDEYPSGDDPWQAGLRIWRRLRYRTVEAAYDPAEYWRKYMGVTREPTLWDDLVSVIRHPRLLLEGVGRIVRLRPPLYKPDRIDVYALVEQLPDAHSRLFLNESRDDWGMPQVTIDWKLHEEEFASVTRFATLVEAEFVRIGLPAPTPTPWMENFTLWKTHVVDRAHQIGTTRMGNDDTTAVVDTNCRVFGLENVFVAGSSVFPTSGHANPTLTIVALAIRLADHLRGDAVDAPRTDGRDEETASGAIVAAG